VPKLIFKVRENLFTQMTRTARLIYNCSNFAPELSRSLHTLTNLYLVAMRAHGDEFSDVVLPLSQTYDTDKGRRMLAIRPFLSCDPPVARKLAEEFEDCPTLVRLCLENDDERAGRGNIREYAQRFPLFLEHLFYDLIKQGRLGDTITEAQGSDNGLPLLKEFVQHCRTDGSGCEKDKAMMCNVHRLIWLLDVEEESYPDSGDTLSQLALMDPKAVDRTETCSSKRRRIHAALGVLSRIAQQDSSVEALRNELKKQDMVQMHVYPQMFAQGHCGIGNYPIETKDQDAARVHRGQLTNEEIACSCVHEVARMATEARDIRDLDVEAVLRIFRQALEMLDMSDGGLPSLDHRALQRLDPLDPSSPEDRACCEKLTERWRVWSLAIRLDEGLWKKQDMERQQGHDNTVFITLVEKWLSYVLERNGDEARGQALSLLRAQINLAGSADQNWMSDMKTHNIWMDSLSDVADKLDDFSVRNIGAKLSHLQEVQSRQYSSFSDV